MKQPDALIEQMQNGNQTAFAKLYDMYSQALFGIINTIINDEDQAQEVLQDVFVKVWEKSKNYSTEKGRFFTWLLNIARNAAIDHVRSKSFKNSKKNLSTENFVSINISTDNLNRATDAIGLKTFVNALKPACIAIIDLLYFKGYTQADTADTLEIPLGTVKTRARNCMNTLRTLVLGH